MRDFLSILLRLAQVPKLGSVRIQQIFGTCKYRRLINYDEVTFQQMGLECFADSSLVQLK